MDVVLFIVILLKWFTKVLLGIYNVFWSKGDSYFI
jgi:hypothetical protein